ncbi:Zinc finger, C3HC-like [Sesbania bispinosa]|nr:Zinc finger, C3HC-like [Sesbania bispinosa]
MAQDSEKRFRSVMDKLFHSQPNPSPSTSSSSGVQLSVGKKRPYQSIASGRGDVGEGQQSSSAVAADAQGQLCRPWDRGDFMRRLATFKSMSWFAKPKTVSAVNCARRGWINVDIDTIACEACGARLLFSTPASWNQQQVEKAALVFSLKLDSGHKLLCPWIDNACNETLARFPPIAPPVLVDNFRERCSALLQLSALPRISSSAIDHMQSPLMEDFLEQSLMLEFGNGSAKNSEIGDVSSQEELKLYYQAQKLISLCGWKLRCLPYVVDCKDIPDQSLKNITIQDCSQVVADVKNNNLIFYSADTGESLKTDENSKYSNGEQIDPNSAVLDCTLCGATVGLWAFCSIPRPVESIRLVGYAEVNGENDLQNRQGENNIMSDVASSSKDTSSGLNMTIAGGPPPTKQNFKAIISLPVIGQNLRARLSYDSDFRDHVFVDGGDIRLDSQKEIGIQEKTDNIVNASIEQLVPVSSETREISSYEAVSQANIHDSVIDDVIEGTDCEGAGQPYSLKDKMPAHTETDGLKSSSVGHPSSSQKDLTEDEALSVSHKTLDNVSSVENDGVKDRAENPDNSEDVNNSLGKFKNPTPSDKAMEFDPVRQHRHFCPWIASIDGGEPGWKQTFSALYHQKKHLPHSPNRSPSSMPIVKVDDPVGSIRKLFTSPSTRKRKLAHISGQNAEHR